MHQAKKDVMNFSNVKLYKYKIFVGFIYNLTDQNWFYGFCKNKTSIYQYLIEKITKLMTME